MHLPRQVCGGDVSALFPVGQFCGLGFDPERPHHPIWTAHKGVRLVRMPGFDRAQGQNTGDRTTAGLLATCLQNGLGFVSFKLPPHNRHASGARLFSVLVPDRPDDADSEPNHKATTEIRNLRALVLTDLGAEDRIVAGLDRVFQKNSARMKRDGGTKFCPTQGIVCIRMCPPRRSKPYRVISGARCDPGYSRISSGSTPHRLLLGAQPP
ncbi:hypothetical protein SAMN05444279_11423 [Ruegeria intermedia]|uniref:Uncharacterized protein n=1 Tax=Ruegeria intermedia TaxID=996115 RepID=A0A1M4Y6D5_9RHOB|nr:hypothetical protein SAMN05444279_11423 [Ruegeria intermedia]